MPCVPIFKTSLMLMHKKKDTIQNFEGKSLRTYEIYIAEILTEYVVLLYLNVYQL